MASGRQCLADGICQTALCQTVWQTPRLPDAVSGRRHLADTVSSRWRLEDAVCLIPSYRRRLPDTVSTRQSGTGPSGRRHLPDSASARRHLADVASARQSGRGPLADGIWPTVPGRWHLPDTVCQAALCQTVWQTLRLPDVASGRRRLADTVSSRRCLTDAAMPDAVCQTLCLPEGRLEDGV